MTLIVGGFAVIGVVITWQQKNRADRRSEWWRRTQWAFERTFSPDAREMELGWTMLGVLTRSRLVTSDDSDVVQMIAEHAALSTNGHGRDGDARAEYKPGE